MSSQLDYDHLLWLDAESLAEGGIRSAYDELLPRLQQHGARPGAIDEIRDDHAPSYEVRFDGRRFVIYAPNLDATEGRSWGRATFAFFTIVNDQIAASPYRLFAINGGNDLAGMLLTPEQAHSARETMAKPTDWPYLPTEQHPWYGMHHQQNDG